MILFPMLNTSGFSIDKNIFLELFQFLELSMLMLSFPMGYICTFIPAVFSSFLDMGIESSSRWHLVLALLVYWALFFVVGYLQWFIVFPRLVSGCISMVAGITGERGSGWLRPVRITYMVTGVMILVATWYYFYHGNGDGDAGVFLVWSMLILSFPAGYICMSVVVGFLFFLHSLEVVEYYSYYGISGSYMSLTLYWALFFMIGYWQWFIVFPRLAPRVPLLAAKFGKERLQG